MSKIRITKISDFEHLHCFDPGGTTGYCHIQVDYARERIYIRDIAEYQTWDKLDIIIPNLDVQTSAVVYESFTIRTMAVNLIPVEVIGVIRYLSCKHLVHSFPRPPANQGKMRLKDSNDDRPIVERWYPELQKFTSHYSSAMRHGIHFVVADILKGKRWPLVYDYQQLMKNLRNSKY